MPWYGRRRWYRPRRRRRFRFRSRFRKTFRNRRYQRRRRVRKKHYRKRKLKKIIVREFQPQTIKKCKIKGLECAFLCNFQKIYFNYQLYEASIVPKHLPGGGGWSVKAFSLNYLYDAHQHCKNIWTKGNYNLPLVKYLGCRIRCYQSLTQDWVFRYQNFYPMVATVDSYCSAQPGLMLMNHHTKKIPSKITYKKKKPYITFRIKPPSLMQNKWYFAHDLSKIPLLMTYCSACSLDNYYIETDKESTNITIYALKTGIFENTNFENKGTTPYWCRQLPNAPFSQVFLYATQHEFEDHKIEAKHIICLGNTREYKGGYAFSDPTCPYKSWQQYKQFAQQMWGNPFYPEYLNNRGTYTIWQSTKTWATITNETNENNKIDFRDSMTPIHELYEELRYSPERDTGESNTVYFTSTTVDVNHWEPPRDTSYTNHGFPLFILLWGYSDFVKRTEKLKDLETKYCLTLRTNTTFPIRNILIPLSKSFINGHSPFETTFNPLDRERWYPSLQMQYEAINDICQTGPGTPKSGGRKTTEAKFEYIFYFKFGGSPPTVPEIEDPSEQTRFPIPNNFRGTTTIESPNTPIQSYLYNFDTKKDIITLKAAKRIKEDWETKENVFTDAKEKAGLEEVYIPPTKKKKEEDSETIQQLIQQLQFQQYLKRRIIRQLTKQSPTK
nr:MAG: ORF1 [TTV-like mini virus]